MRPLIRSLFVLSFFGLLAMHVSTGVLRDIIANVAPWMVDLIDRFLRTMLIAPLGRTATIYGLWAVGASLAFVAFIFTPTTKGKGAERHSTW